jgi:hypothetical protein
MLVRLRSYQYTATTNITVGKFLEGFEAQRIRVEQIPSVL